MINKLDWDSSFFGYKVGKYILHNQNELLESVFFSQAEEFRLVYIFSKSALQSTLFNLVDVKITLSKNIKSEEFIVNSNENLSFDSFSRGIHDLKKLEKLGLQSGVYSRFNLDQCFENNEYEKLYLRWVHESVNGNLAFDNIIAITNGEIVGFTTLQKRTNEICEIGLVAIDSDQRGKGIGSRLIQEAVNRCITKDFKVLKVSTQETNIPALRLYQKAGFEIESKTFIYHYWNR